MPTPSPSPVVPVATQVSQGLVALSLLVLAGLGVTDGQIPTLVKAAMPPAVALVLAVIALAHHWTLSTAATAAAAAGQVGQVLATTTVAGTPAGIPVAGETVAQVAALTGQVLEASRAGVLAVADTGRHLADAPTVVLPPVLPDPYPPAVPTAGSFPSIGV